MAKPSETALIATACIALVASIWFAGAFAFLAAGPLAESIGSKAHSVRLAVVAFSAGATVCVLSLGLNLWWLLHRWRRERLLNQLANSELASEAERTKATMSSVAATCHEVRTPVHAIIGFSNLLRDSKLDDIQMMHVETLKRSAEHLLDIVNDGLNPSGVFTGRAARNTVVDLDALIGETHAMTAALCPRAGMRIRSRRDPLLSRHVEADAVQLRQLLLNLTGNAVKYAPSGQIDIVASATSDDRGRFLRFEVLDEGPGLSDEAARTLFRSSAATTGDPVRGSAGLGLLISERIVQNLGGEIGYAARRPAGSRFWFEIPLLIPDVSPQSAGGGPAAMNILVADDATSSLVLMGEVLRRRGHRVTAVANGESAVRAAASARYDVIFLDLRMAGIGGLGAAEQIRLLPAPNGAGKVYALSGAIDAVTRIACLASGMDGCLVKPLLPSVLDEVLASSRQQDRVGGGAS